MPTRSDDPQALQEFAASLGTRDPKTIATYQTTVRDFVVWLALQPGGAPFHLGLVTETAVHGYMDFLAATKRAPRTRSKALSALRRFCQWAVDEGHLRRNPARAMEALIEELRARHVILPAVSTLERLGWETRRRAQHQVFTTLTQGLSEEQKK